MAIHEPSTRQSVTLRQLFDYLRISLNFRKEEEELFYFGRTEDDEPYDYIYFEDQEIRHEPDGSFRIESFEGEFEPIYTDVNGVIGFVTGSRCAYNICSTYQLNSNGTKEYKEGFLATSKMVIKMMETEKPPEQYYPQEPQRHSGLHLNIFISSKVILHIVAILLIVILAIFTVSRYL